MMSPGLKKFGFDLDNTIIDYSESAYQYCVVHSLKTTRTLRELKNQLVETDPTTTLWNKAQSWIYTDGLEFAQLANGLENFMAWLKLHNFVISIHSHKTLRTPVTSGEVNLHSPMIRWLKKSNLGDFLDLDSALSFYENQNLKVLGIRNSEVNFFVDDLVDIFVNRNFPNTINSFLIPPDPKQPEWVVGVSSFDEILEKMTHDFR